MGAVPEELRYNKGLGITAPDHGKIPLVVLREPRSSNNTIFISRAFQHLRLGFYPFKRDTTWCSTLRGPVRSGTPPGQARTSSR
ncbi:unnamed protein product [Gadus morhua 'NCC']